MTRIILVANTDWFLYNFRLSLAKDLRAAGIEVVLVSPPGRFVSRLQSEGFRWLAWEVGRQTLAPWTELRALLRLAAIYRQERPDLVHHFTVKPVLYGSLAARWQRVPAVVNSVTGLGYVFLNQDLKARLVRQLVRQFYRLAFGHPNSAVIFENDNDRQYLAQSGLVDSQHSYVIEGAGVDADYFSLQPEPVGRPLVVLPARMLWDKGVGVLVEAARRLKGVCDLRVALAGNSDPGNPANIPAETLRLWTEEGAVEWWGFQEDMLAVYRQANIVTLPSMGEGLPTALIEAAACGRPIVATDVPGCRTVVVPGVTGLLVPPNDPVALAEALVKLASDPGLRRQMGLAGRQRVLDHFTDRLVNEQTRAVYGRLEVS